MTSRWLEFPRPEPAAPVRLFCLPYAGGGASVFRAWPAAAPGVEVVAIRLPGRESRFAEPPIRAMDLLVEALAVEVGPLLDRPYAVFGHSAGALVAFDLVRRLRRAGRPAPVRLLVAGRGGPRTVQPKLSGLPDGALREYVTGLGGAPPETGGAPELLDLMLPVLRADFALGDGYVYREEPPLEVPIRAFHGTRDQITERARVLDWAAETAAGFALEEFDDDHFFLHSRRERLLGSIVAELLAPDPS